MGKLTTHVLDTARGCPGAGIAIRLFRIDSEADTGTRPHTPVAAATTNADGRCEHPLLEGSALTTGRYELVFAAGEYFRAQGLNLAEPLFVDEVVLRFGIADASAHYHVPLLVSPWSYSTYRGS